MLSDCRLRKADKIFDLIILIIMALLLKIVFFFQMYFQSIHQKVHHLTTAEYDDFTSIILHARKVSFDSDFFFTVTMVVSDGFFSLDDSRMCDIYVLKSCLTFYNHSHIRCIARMKN